LQVRWPRGAALSAAGLGFLAWRAGDLSAADPVAYLAAFAAKGRGRLAACVVQNYSPVAFLYRLGLPTSPVVTLAIAALLWFEWLLLRQAEVSRA
jgi:hypothetical protein